MLETLKFLELVGFSIYTFSYISFYKLKARPSISYTLILVADCVVAKLATVNLPDIAEQ